MKFGFIILLFSTVVSAQTPASKIDVDQYLNQVTSNNPAYKASRLGAQANHDKISDANLMYFPQFNLNAERGVDGRPTTQPSFQGRSSEGKKYQAGFSELTPFGLKGQLYYSLNYRQIDGASPAFVPVPNYWTAAPTIELSQSLWRNALGSEDEAQYNLIKYDAEVKYFGEQFHNHAIVVEARNTYLSLYYLRKTIAALKDSLAVSDRLQNWAAKRVKNELGDESDYLQTKAASDLRELELLKAQNQLLTAERAFNSLRGIESDEVTENLEPMKMKSVPKKPATTVARLDVKAAEKSLELAKASNSLAREKVRPTLEIYGMYSYNSLNVDIDQSNADALGHHPAYIYGIRFSTPLAISKATSMHRAYTKEIESAELNLHRKKQEEDRDYKNLFSQIENSSARLNLAQRLEISQKKKLENERRRHQRGRTTLFQVLQFEQEYVTSQLNTIQTELELNTSLNQLDLYESETP